ncbi:hypothetical protein THI4931_07620 [Pandoraea sputorum]|nr:hypothetical protein THI4931_07620 [Pandoraea sputorum]
MTGRLTLAPTYVQHDERAVTIGRTRGPQLETEGAQKPLAIQQQIGEDDLPSQRVRIVHLGRQANIA